MVRSPLDDAERQHVLAILAGVPDPEIPAVSVIDLGIVRQVRADPPAVLITPTYTGCPATLAIEQAIRAALDDAGFHGIAVETVISPPWTTELITDDGRERLREYGIAPPSMEPAKSSLGAAVKLACPRCGSMLTREVSRFGSTPCKSLWSCRACQESFEHFKCH